MENDCCPITLEKFINPVIIPECGHTFERSAIIDHIKTKKECPVCKIKVFTNPFSFPFNWYLISSLNLSVDKNAIVKLKENKKDKKKEEMEDTFNSLNNKFLKYSEKMKKIELKRQKVISEMKKIHTKYKKGDY